MAVRGTATLVFGAKRTDDRVQICGIGVQEGFIMLLLLLG